MSGEDVANPRGSATALDLRLATRASRRLSLLVGIAALACAYFAAARLSLLLAIPPGYATAVWPASGVALAALLLYGRRLWPGILIGSFLANAPTSLAGVDPSGLPAALLIAASIGTGASLQALLATKLLEPIFRRDPGLLETSSVVGVLGLGGALSCLTSATWGSITLQLSGVTAPEQFPVNWVTWWTGDVIGVLLVLPLAYIGLGRPRRLWRRRFAPVALPLALTTVAVTYAFFASNLQEKHRVQLEFEREAVAVGDSLAQRLATYLEVVHSIQSLYAASTMVTREEFKQFVERTLQRVPGIQALSWNPRIRHAERASYEAAARRDGLHDFTITESQGDDLVPAADRPEYMFVHYIEPREGNEHALGYDVYSDPTRRAAIDEARDRAEAVATSAITLVQETGRQMGILVLVPFYENGTVPPSVEERRLRLMGYTVGVFRIEDLLRTALIRTHTRNLDVRLFEVAGNAPTEPLAALRIDDQGRPRPLVVSTDDASGDILTWSNTYPVAGRTWRLEITPAPGYLTPYTNWQAWTLLAGGLSLTALLGVFLLNLTGRRILDEQWATQLANTNSRLRDEIEQREHTERELQAERDRAKITLHSIGDAVITTDGEGTIEYMNPVAEKLTAWRLGEAKGQPICSVLTIITEASREPATDPIQECLQQDRVVTPADQTVLISRDGREYAIQDSAAPIRDRDGRVLGAVLVFNDVTETRRMVREVAHQASHDSLTELYNRREFDKRLDRALASGKKYGSRHALCYIDLDHFKRVNDTAGHRAGDELLKRLARLLEAQVRERDTVARLGGDEFGVLLDSCPIERAVEIADKIVASVRALNFSWEDREYSIGVSIGVVEITGAVETAEELSTQADVACYKAKDLGRNQAKLYDADA